MAARYREREREWGLSEASVATVGGGGESPKRQRCPLRPLHEKRNSSCPVRIPQCQSRDLRQASLSLSISGGHELTCLPPEGAISRLPVSKQGPQIGPALSLSLSISGGHELTCPLLSLKYYILKKFLIF